MPAQAAGFGAQLRRYRERAGLTREALAERAQLSTSGIAALECGRRQQPYPDTLRRLGDALALSSDECALLAAALSRPAGAVTPHEPPASEPPALPAARTPLIGREHAVTTLAALVPEHPGRLVTLTGICGVGKTRLALAVAAAVQHAFPDGIRLIELAPLADPALVQQAVAMALGVPDGTAMPLLDCLVATLRPRTLLLVLDNCEHLIDGCAELADRLLADCPNLRILATSREPLQLAGERRWPVPPLALPEGDGSGSVAALAASAAVQLFVDRAQAVDGSFRLTAQNAAAVAQVCIGLAGVPLALELAAAQVRVLSVAQIHDRLDDSLRFLNGRRRAAPARQQTLRAALDWSHQLLSAPEQAVFRRLGAFAGPFEISAAEAVCATADLPAGSVLGLLAQLADKSLLVVEPGVETAHYRLLKPVRQYALDQLTAYGELTDAQARHFRHYRILAEHAAPALRGPGQVGWLTQLEAAHANLRAALRWAVARGDAAAGLRFAVALAPFWEGRGHLGEGRRWLTTLQALPAARNAPSTTRTAALLAEGRLAQWQADLDGAAEALVACLALARSLEDQRLVADALAWLGVVRRQQGAVSQSADLLQQSLELYRTANHSEGIAFALVNLGATRRADGDLAASAALFEKSLVRYRTLGDVRYCAMACTMLAATLLQQGHVQRAVALAREGLICHHTVGDRAFVVHSVACHAGLAAAQGKAERAARLLGAMTALRGALAAPHTALSEREAGKIEAAVRNRLGEAGFAAAWQAGRALSLNEAIALALESSPPGLLRVPARLPDAATVEPRPRHNHPGDSIPA
jgi:predicted ATPase/transcriptional regulator with XRE-family HTH domain